MSGSQSQLPRNWQPWPAHEMISVPIGRDSIQKQKAYYGKNRGHSSNCVRVEERKRPSQSALEGTDGARTGSNKLAAPTLVKAKKGGRGLTSEGRKRLSEMMKKRWAERRRKGTVSRK